MDIIRQIGANKNVTINKLYEHIPDIENYFLKFEKKSGIVEISFYKDNQEIKEIEKKE